MNNEDKILSVLESLVTTVNELKQGQAATNERLDKVDQRLDKVDQRLDKVDQRLDSIEKDIKEIKTEQRYMWEDIKKLDTRTYELKISK